MGTHTVDMVSQCLFCFQVLLGTNFIELKVSCPHICICALIQRAAALSSDIPCAYQQHAKHMGMEDGLLNQVNQPVQTTRSRPYATPLQAEGNFRLGEAGKGRWEATSENQAPALDQRGVRELRA